VRVGEELVPLTPTELRVLDALVRTPGRAFTRQELVERAFGEDYDGLDRTVDVHVMNVRRKLGEAGKAIRTVFGIGYRLTP
jgi:DNA-binding response OmpR family regulator